MPGGVNQTGGDEKRIAGLQRLRAFAIDLNGDRPCHNVIDFLAGVPVPARGRTRGEINLRDDGMMAGGGDILILQNLSGESGRGTGRVGCLGQQREKSGSEERQEFHGGENRRGPPYDGKRLCPARFVASAPAVLQALSPPRAFVFLLAAFRAMFLASYPVVLRIHVELRRRMEAVLVEGRRKVEEARTIFLTATSSARPQTPPAAGDSARSCPRAGS